MFRKTSKEIEEFYENLKKYGFNSAKPWFYLSASLTDAPNPKELREFYEKIGEIVRAHGCFCYLPMWITPPEKPGIFPVDVYETDMKAVKMCKKGGAMIAVLEVQSFGVGAEIQKAFSEGVRLIYLIPSGTKISRLIKGGGENIRRATEGMIMIYYRGYTDALNKLSKVLEKLGYKKTL